ncbi:MAG: hypothetical protein ACYC7F_11995, partial [Gemmatimonadaceae bacterium]
ATTVDARAEAPPSTVYRPPSTVHRLPSTVYRLPSTVCPYAALANARLTARRAPRLMLRLAARA